MSINYVEYWEEVLTVEKNERCKDYINQFIEQLKELGFGCVLFDKKEISKEEILNDMSTEEIIVYLNSRLKKLDQVLITVKKSQVKVFNE